jgi:hypothetical protein
MPQAKCLFKSANDSQCCRSTSEHHCKVVTDEICGACCMHQSKPTIGDKQMFKGIIRKSLKLMETDAAKAIKMLEDALKI